MTTAEHTPPGAHEADGVDEGPGHPHVDGGLAHDLPRVLSRRRALTGLLGGAGAALLAACARGADSPGTAPTDVAPATSSTAPTSPAGSPAVAGDSEIPEETAGPFPADGSNGANVLAVSGIVRKDLRPSFGGSTGVAAGVPLRVQLTLVDVRAGGTPVVGAAVYLWHATRDGAYSLYSSGITEENYLRGVQVTGSDGRLEFLTIWPGAYDGRWPHMHFEVYASVATATSAASKLRTSQLALPPDWCERVYATQGYEQSLRNLARTSLDTDNVFRDGYSLQLATVTGSISTGLVASLTVPV